MGRRNKTRYAEPEPFGCDSALTEPKPQEIETPQETPPLVGQGEIVYSVINRNGFSFDLCVDRKWITFNAYEAKIFDQTQIDSLRAQGKDKMFIIKDRRR
jgi:hypothetical protein